MKFGGKRGFTLLELMITIGIIGILSAIAIPTYRNYVVTAKRSEAQQNLVQLASRMENCYSLNNTYTGCVNANSLSSKVAENYDLTSTVNAAGNEFLLSLVAKGGQKGDKKVCQQLAINHLGRKYSGCSTVATCGSASADSESNKCW
ncbi:MAG: type IV pilin protein [Ruminobacter sp.]|nr:type IV pilin protein [Ruminobacter sp.]